MAGTHHVVIVADGDVDAGEIVAHARTGQAASAPRPFVMAADGGAARCLAAGVRPDLVVGDLDSLDGDAQARLEGMGVEMRVAAADKDESDMELCLLAAVAAGAQRVTVLGALGIVRPEHGIANLLLLADPRLDGLDVTIVGRGSRITRVGSVAGPGEARVEGRAGDFVSLLPLGPGVDGVTSDGLRFPLLDETLPLGPSRGLSNEMLGSTAGVSTKRGCLLLVHTARSGGDTP